MTFDVEPNVRILAPVLPEFQKILTPDALRFLTFLHRNFNGKRLSLLQKRVQKQMALDSGQLLTFLPETKYIREGNWKVASIPADLMDRRVEITGPVDRKMVINALNSGARCYMADFEDSTAPTWFNQVDGQVNLFDAVRRTISYLNPKTGKEYKLNPTVATLLVRPRGWHLDEAHVTVDEQVMSGSLFDFGLFFFHNAYELLSRDSGPYFYLPKLESHLEARLWNEVFVAAQGYVGIWRGSIRATVLIETLSAGFEMDEILYELREHSSGLNCGRWDYIFSYIKKLKNHANFVLPDRADVTMKVKFMDSYVKLLVQTCHRRGAHAMGGMAAHIPVKNDEKKNKEFMNAVIEDKKREVTAGHDGTWVAHPGLVKVAMDVFDSVMPSPNQISYLPDAGAEISADDLLEGPKGGKITMNGLEENVDVALMYTEAWLRGNGCIPLNNKMEDAATAEISRTQVWQWIRHEAHASDGTKITKELVHGVLERRKQVRSKEATGKNHKFQLAAKLLVDMLVSNRLEEFLTLACYPSITTLGMSAKL